MTPPLPEGYVRFHGQPAIFWMAICARCDLALPHGTEAARDEWVKQHSQAGWHTLADISLALDIRPAEGTVPMMRPEK